MLTPTHHGSCLCAGVRYTLCSTPKAISHCHCTACRKSHGAAFASFGAVPRGDLSITHGQALIQSYASSVSVLRQFCQRCGSSLFWSKTAGAHADWICVALGTLDSGFTPTKCQHVHLAAQPAWSPQLACESPNG